MEKNTFAELFKKKREEKKLSFGKLGKLTGVTAGILFRYEKGHSHPTLKTLQNICRVLDLDPQDTLRLIQKEKNPEAAIDDYYKSTPRNIDLVNTAASLSDIIAPKPTKYIEENNSEAMNFKVTGNFLFPLVEPGERALVLFSHNTDSFSLGDFVILSINDNIDMQRKIQAFATANMKLWSKFHKSRSAKESGSATVELFGKLVGKTSSEWIIQHPKQDDMKLSIKTNNIDTKAKLIGKLFGNSSANTTNRDTAQP